MSSTRLLASPSDLPGPVNFDMAERLTRLRRGFSPDPETWQENLGPKDLVTDLFLSGSVCRSQWTACTHAACGLGHARTTQAKSSRTWQDLQPNPPDPSLPQGPLWHILEAPHPTTLPSRAPSRQLLCAAGHMLSSTILTAALCFHAAPQDLHDDHWSDRHGTLSPAQDT